MLTSTELKTTAWLNKYSQYVELEPFFQRGDVWDQKRQQLFIDSIIRGWGTPKIFLFQSSQDSFDCLDGKQRLTALFKFMSNSLPLGGINQAGFQGKTYSELPRNVQDAFDSYKISVEIITQADQEEIVELYKRLQQGVALNFGEKLFATPGNIGTFIKQKLLVNNFFKKTVQLSNNRYSHYAVCAQLCLLGVKGAVEDLKLKNIEDFFEIYSKFNQSGAEAKKILDIIKYLDRMFSGLSKPGLGNRANIVSAFYLISDLQSRGDITGREKELGSFFKKFVESIQNEFKKDPDKRDSSIISYQTAVTQGADKIRSVKLRNDILLKRLALESSFFSDLLNPTRSPEDIFKELYSKLEKFSKKDTVADVDSFLISNSYFKQKSCKSARKTIETIVGHIRNCIHHSKHGTYSKKQILLAIRKLEIILK